MHELSPQFEQMLRAQGLGSAEIEELRRTGRFDRCDEAGNTLLVNVQSATGPEMVINGRRYEGEGTTFTPAALEQLRRFHKLIPRAVRDEIERTTGQDIDGDGHVGPAAGASSNVRSPRTANASSAWQDQAGDGRAAWGDENAAHHHPSESGPAQRVSTSSGPFMSTPPSGRLSWWFVYAAIFVIAYLALR
ncbi:MAG: hypothetical protein ABI200_00490 [Gaiellales bacterium]